MWNGSRSGPRGGMPFCGDPRGEMFEGRNRPMPGFRGREGMNMGAQDRPPMDMRRFDYSPDMMGRNMGLLDRGRDSPRDFFMPENDLDFRRRLEMEQNAPGYVGQGRPSLDMGGRDMQVRNIRGHEDQFMDMRERDRFRMDMPGFNMSPVDVRRRLAMESMDRNDHIREMGRPQMGMNDIDGFSMDMPPRDRSVDFNRRGCVPPLNPRGRFESDMDFRNRMGQTGDFRDRSPQMFHGNDGMNLRGRPDMPPDRQGPEKDMLKVGEPTLRDREFPEQAENRSGFRGEDNSLSEEWCRRMNRSPNLASNVKKRFPHGPGKEGELGEPSQFKDRERPSVEIPAKERGNSEFSRPEREDSKVRNWDNVQTDVPGRDLPHPVPQKLPLLPLNPSLNIPSKDKESQRWSRDEKPDSTILPGGRHPFFPDKNLSVKESHFSVDQGNFKGKDMPLDEGQKKGSLLPVPRDPQSNREGRRDQDYGDIDYRTNSAQKYDYILEDLQGPEKNLKTPKSAPPERSTASGSQDQDYRNANVQDKISKTIAISGIPKTATMQQILDAFAVRDGVPMQGMKIRDVVPGYSSDTAYVEFLNIEDAVHFMESNQGSVKVGSKTALLKYIQPERNSKEPQHDDQPHKVTPPQDGLLPCPVLANPPKLKDDGSVKSLHDPLSQSGWQRSSTLTPEAWQQQVDKQLQQQEMEKQAEEWANQRGPRANQQFSDPVFKESRTMIIKNILPTTTVETILRSLDTFAYLDERNVRLVKGKTPGSKCFCFVDMDSHEHVTRLVDLLTKPRPIMIDGVRVYAEVAKPLKNQNYRRDLDKSNSSLLGCPPDVMEQQQQYFPQSLTTTSTSTQGMGASAEPLQTEFSLPAASIQSSSINQGAIYVEPSVEAAQQKPPSTSDTTHTVTAGESEDYSYTSDTPDLSAFLYDATSGFYYDPQTTLYYDPNSRYFYNAQTQQYLYWDSTTKIYIPVEGENTGTNMQKQNLPVEAESAAAEELKTGSEGAPDRREDDDTMSRSEKKEKEKEDKPRSLAAFKIMKDMERWAKIQNRQKDSVRAPSPVLRSGAEDKKASKAADAAFAVFERKTTGGDDLFKKPLAPPKKDEKGSKKPMGSLGLLAADYAAGSDDEEEEKHEKHEASTPPAPPVKSQPESQEKEDRLTDWKKMACLLCRRQFPSKDALIRHQQLSDLHKQNMEIHLKIKKSKRELEALENQEKEMHMKETCSPPDAKKRKQQNAWPSSSRDTHKGNERPGLGLESTERNKKDGVVWNYATYKQAVRKAMFARFKELE